MGTINDGNLQYPGAIPTWTNRSAGEVLPAAEQNGQGGEVVNICTELGTNPSGSSASVADRLNQFLSVSTAGQVVFSDGTGYTGDTDFFWNNTTKRLGIGTSSPQSLLSVQAADVTAADFVIRHTASGAGYGWVFETTGTTTNDLIISSQLNAANTERFRFDIDGALYINDTSNADMTVGITINQGASDNDVIGCKSSDVSHGMTAQIEDDTFLSVRKWVGASGGVWLRGFSEIDIGVGVHANVATEDTTKNTGSTGGVVIYSSLKSGSSVASHGADANLAVIRNHSTARFIFDAEGSAHADVEWTTFDGHDDVALLDALDTLAQPQVQAEFGRFLLDHETTLQREKIVNFYDPERKRVMLNTTKLLMLLTGAVRQVGSRLNDMEQRLIDKG